MQTATCMLQEWRAVLPFLPRLLHGLVANTGGVIMTTFDVFLSVLLPAPSPALPEAPWLVLLVWGATWIPRERPNSSTSSDDGAAKSAFGGYRGVEPAVP